MKSDKCFQFTALKNQIKREFESYKDNGKYFSFVCNMIQTVNITDSNGKIIDIIDSEIREALSYKIFIIESCFYLFCKNENVKYSEKDATDIILLLYGFYRYSNSKQINAMNPLFRDVIKNYHIKKEIYIQLFKGGSDFYKK